LGYMGYSRTRCCLFNQTHCSFRLLSSQWGYRFPPGAPYRVRASAA
jgi:hypothetical protein